MTAWKPLKTHCTLRTRINLMLGEATEQIYSLTFSLLSLSLSLSTPTALGHYLYNPPTLTHTHIHKPPVTPPSSLLFLLAPQLRACYCCKLWQERQQLGYSRPIRIYGCVILLNSCPLNFKPQDKGRITDWLTDSKVILKSGEAVEPI